MRPIRTIAVFPTLLTLGNLMCGFFAIVVASRIDKPETLLDTVTMVDTQNVMISGWLIFLAMVFDGLDGYVARLARTTSDFGAQLDSLCDMVSFGVAPGFLMVKMCPRFTYWHDQAVWVIAAAFAACAALRLARFNVETNDDDDHLYFSGLPSPAAAAVIAGFAIAFFTLRKEPNALKNVIDNLLAGNSAILRPAGRAVDGLADSLSAHYQSRLARPAKLWARRGGAVLLCRHNGCARIRGANGRLRICPVWTDPRGVADVGAAAGSRRTTVLIGYELEVWKNDVFWNRRIAGYYCRNSLRAAWLPADRKRAKDRGRFARGRQHLGQRLLPDSR